MGGTKVTIVGGGASGTLVAAHLLASRGPLQIDLIEPRAELGLGLAYSTDYSAHLMNVRAGNLSVFPDQPRHFVEWLEREYGTRWTAAEFVPRALFGRYVRSVFAERRNAAGPEVRFVRHRHRARSLDWSGGSPVVTLDSGEAIPADFVVIATGNLSPSVPHPLHPVAEAPGYFGSAWAAGALAAEPGAGDALILGTGLTAVDAVLGLAGGEWRGTIYAVSRHGWWSRCHSAPAPAPPPPTLEELPLTSRGLLRWVRQAIRSTAASGGDWRGIIDSLRPVTNPLWSRLPLEEKRRFLRHLRSLWDIHRHRMAPSAADRLDALAAEGRLQTLGGHIVSVDHVDDEFRVRIRPRGAAEERELRVARIINCTGTAGSYTALADPLLGSLFDQELVAPDPLRQGLAVNDEGQLLRPDGLASGFLYAVGPPRIGTLQETVAIPEIREQTLAVAAQIRARID